MNLNKYKILKERENERKTKKVSYLTQMVININSERQREELSKIFGDERLAELIMYGYTIWLKKRGYIQEVCLQNASKIIKLRDFDGKQEWENYMDKNGMLIIKDYRENPEKWDSIFKINEEE